MPTSTSDASPIGGFPRAQSTDDTSIMSATRLETSLIEIGPDTDFEALVGSLTCSPFQSPLWLSTWFGTIGQSRGAKGYWLSLSARGATVLALPLILTGQRNCSTLEIPDLGVTDYAAPLLGPPNLLASFSASQLWRAILGALPKADLLRLERIPLTVNGAHNPLARHSFALPSRISGWRRPLPAAWDDYLTSLSPSMREKILKAWRRFGRADSSSVRRISDTREAASCLAQLSRWQAERMDEKGRNYELDDPALNAFYSRLVEKGLSTGQVMMMALEAEHEPVALNYGFRAGNQVVYLRVGNSYGRWSPMSPGLLATKAILKESLACGVETFDFGAGDYEYKVRFGGQKVPLEDLVLPLSVRGWPVALAHQLRRRLSRVTFLKRLLTRFRSQS